MRIAWCMHMRRSLFQIRYTNVRTLIRDYAYSDAEQLDRAMASECMQRGMESGSDRAIGTEGGTQRPKIVAESVSVDLLCAFVSSACRFFDSARTHFGASVLCNFHTFIFCFLSVNALSEMHWRHSPTISTKCVAGIRNCHLFQSLFPICAVNCMCVCVCVGMCA